MIKKLMLCLFLLLLLPFSLPALDFSDVLRQNIGKQAFIYIGEQIIRYGGDPVKYPLYIVEVMDDILVLKARSIDITVYIAIEKITAVEIDGCP